MQEKDITIGSISSKGFQVLAITHACTQIRHDPLLTKHRFVGCFTCGFPALVLCLSTYTCTKTLQQEVNSC